MIKKRNGCVGEAVPASFDGGLRLEAGATFVTTPEIERVVNRALTYLNAGYPVHFSGPAGTGKTTLALHVAALRARPVTLMHGDDEFGSGDLVGGEYGYRKSKVVDNFIHSVLKTEESLDTLWTDNRLTIACKRGDTLVYDEFTRSRPEANNALLSVLEEKLLTVPKRRPDGDGYLEVDPEFRAIFTSNPEEYAGVHRTQDALMDRLVTIRLDYFDARTETAIACAKSGLGKRDAQIVVDIVRELRRLGLTKQGPSLRACIMIARMTALQGVRAHAEERLFREICRDVLGSHPAKVMHDGATDLSAKIDELVRRYCAPTRSGGTGRRRQPAADPLFGTPVQAG